MLAALDWFGMEWDEGPDIGGPFGPYVQSQRRQRHLAVADQLLQRGAAYYGDDPEHPGDSAGNPLRLRLPRTGEIAWKDALRGPIVVPATSLTDPVLVRTDGQPVYHLAAMVDDHDMAISHVLRGEEYIPTTPGHVTLYRAMGWPEPIWVHLPLIRKRLGQKLSKRDPDGGYLVSDFQAAGYLPAALFNYLLLLGWAPDNTEEILDRWTVRQQFRLERLSASSPLFDWDKLNWVNRQYLARLSDAALAERIEPFLEAWYGPLPAASGWLEALTRAIRAGMSRLVDAVDLAAWAFDAELEYTPEAQAALQGDAAKPVLARFIAELAQLVLLDERTAASLVTGLRRQFAEERGWSARTVLLPVRAGVLGHTDGPPLPQALALLGKARTLQRAANALKYA
jgi:glutamyl-tRNA synthetase